MPRKKAQIVRLTKTTVDNASPGPVRYTVWDSELKGFGVRITPEGAKTYIVRYRAGGGRSGTLRQMVVGRHGALTADKARAQAEKILAAVTLGGDPQDKRAAARAEMKVSALCDLYIAEGCGLKKPGTVYIDQLRIDRHIKPLLGKLRVSAVRSADIERFMADVAAGKTRTEDNTQTRGGKGAATRTVGLLGGIFTFAVSRGLRGDNPVRGVKRYRDRKMERFLSPKELGALGDALTELEAEGVTKSALTIIRLLALTGARKSEIIGLCWAEVDIGRSCLRLKDSKTGAKIVPLGAPATTMLAELKKGAGDSALVFPYDGDATRHFVGTERIWAKVCKRANLPGVRIHDLRHSFASIGVAGGQGLTLIGKLLGHADTATTARYAHLADDPVKAAADRISEAVDAAMGGKSADVRDMAGRKIGR